MQTVAIPDYESIPGNCGAYVLQQSTDDVTHFVMLTFWDNKEAVAAFAGAEIEKAKYYDFDHKFLLELEPHVQHYEIFGK
jgi:heme-degrading monooxygenase HmoA